MALSDHLSEELSIWALSQPMFFVATAPLSGQGHVNVSPRGLDTFRVLGPREVAYLDLTGSGNETAAHVTENGRITLMFCAFSGPPRILRLYGQGTVVLPDSALWADLRPNFPAALPGVRQILHARVTRVQTSCGYGVPQFGFLGQRRDLVSWAESKGAEALELYRARRNARSLDGLPAPGFSDSLPSK